MGKAKQELRKKLFKLHNTIHWDPRKPDKVFLPRVQIAIGAFRFETRQVYVRFVDGPALDASLPDMDRIVLEYLKLRGIKPPAQLCKLAANKAPAPAPVDFIVPGHLMPKPPNSGE